MRYFTTILVFFLTLHPQIVTGASTNFDKYAHACLKDPFQKKTDLYFSPKIPANLLPNGCSAIEYLEDVPLIKESFNSSWNVRGGPEALRTEPIDFFYNPLISWDFRFQADLDKTDWFIEELSILSDQITSVGLDKILPDKRWEIVQQFGFAYLGLDELCSANVEYFKQRFFIKELLFKHEFLKSGLIGIDGRSNYISEDIRFYFSQNKNKNYCEVAARSIKINTEALIAQFYERLNSRKYIQFNCGPLEHLILNRHKGYFLVPPNLFGPPFVYRPVYKVRQNSLVLADERCIGWADQNIAFIEKQLQANLANEINIDELRLNEIIK